MTESFTGENLTYGHSLHLLILLALAHDSSPFTTAELARLLLSQFCGNALLDGHQLKMMVNRVRNVLLKLFRAGFLTRKTQYQAQKIPFHIYELNPLFKPSILSLCATFTR